VRDTDGGLFDGDARFDRALGPMQFIPSTWSVVGVDADGDSRRNPQDIDDAALATAVYLGSGPEDLSTHAGQRAAAYRYNHYIGYVRLVLTVAREYGQTSPAASTPFTTAPFTTVQVGDPPGVDSLLDKALDHDAAVLRGDLDAAVVQFADDETVTPQRAPSRAWTPGKHWAGCSLPPHRTSTWSYAVRRARDCGPVLRLEIHDPGALAPVLRVRVGLRCRLSK
jgi:hypothetical protein